MRNSRMFDRELKPGIILNAMKKILLIISSNFKGLFGVLHTFVNKTVIKSSIEIIHRYSLLSSLESMKYFSSP